MTENVNELLDLLIALDDISARTYEIPERSQDRRALAGFVREFVRHARMGDLVVWI